MNLRQNFILILGLFIFHMKGQEHEIKESSSIHDFRHHQIGLMLGHTHISQGVQNGDKKWEVLPSIVLNYNYWFNEKWGLGIHTDIVVETYEVEKHLKSGSDEILERAYPVAPAVMGMYKPKKHFSYLVGVGGEFANTENLFLVRGEVAYGIHILKEIELETSISYDLRFNAYDSWGLAIGISKYL